MKNYNIYYLIIAFFVLMIFVPPLLRYSMPKEDTPTSTSSNNNDTTNNSNNTPTENQINTNINILLCNLSEPYFSISTTYDNNNLTLISATSEVLSDNIEANNSIINDMISLIGTEGVAFNNNIMTFNFLNNDYSSIATLQKYTRDINTQKTYYEQLGLTCTVSKS